jgi:hypothetical protein
MSRFYGRDEKGVNADHAANRRAPKSERLRFAEISWTNDEKRSPGFFSKSRVPSKKHTLRTPSGAMTGGVCERVERVTTCSYVGK